MFTNTTIIIGDSGKIEDMENYLMFNCRSFKTNIIKNLQRDFKWLELLHIS